MWLLLNDLDAESARRTDASCRVPFLELGSLVSPESRDAPGRPSFAVDPISFAGIIEHSKQVKHAYIP